MYWSLVRTGKYM